MDNIVSFLIIDSNSSLYDRLHIQILHLSRFFLHISTVLIIMRTKHIFSLSIGNQRKNVLIFLSLLCSLQEYGVRLPEQWDTSMMEKSIMLVGNILHCIKFPLHNLASNIFLTISVLIFFVLAIINFVVEANNIFITIPNISNI